MDAEKAVGRSTAFPLHGWLGLLLVAVFWYINWNFTGLRTHWAFFPLWLGYALTVDGLVFLRRGTSLLARDWRKYIGLFFVSIPVWWIFEGVNVRLQNWHYVGAEYFTPWEFFLLASLSFSTVVPAVFGTAELVRSFNWLENLGRGPIISASKRVTVPFFLAGWAMFAVMWLWPNLFFPFVWISLYFLMEPINIWLGNRSLVDWLQRGDWRPVMSLWVGVLITAFFWEMWNYFSYPKWIYTVPWANCCHLFEMPALGYGGYLPFSLELFAMYHIMMGLIGKHDPDYVQVAPDPGESLPLS
jgi:hypothetical protein